MEQIGIEGVFELDGFDQGMKQYMSGIEDMNNKTEKSASALGKSFDTMGEKVNSVATKMGTAVVAGAAVAAAALVGWAAKGVSQAMDLEAQLGEVAVLLHKTTAEVKPLEQEIIKLAMDPKLAVNTKEAADAVQELAKQGFTMDQIIQGGARSAVVLANATGTDVVSAANLAKNTIDSFNLSTDDMGRVTQGIAAVVNSTEMSFEDYNAAINQAGSTIISTGISFEDFNTVLAATTDYTKSGGDAGKTFTQIIQKMTSPTDASKKAMKELGLSFTDANGQMLPMPQILKNIENSMASSHTSTVKLATATTANSKEAQHYASVIKATQQKLQDYATGVAGVAQSEDAKKVSIDRLNRVLAAAQAEYAKYGGVQAGVTTVTTKLTEAQKQHDLELIFGSKAMREVNGLLALGSDGYVKLQATLAKRSAEEDAATRMDNFKAIIQNVKDTMDALTLQIGIAFLPIVTEMGKKVAQFLGNHGTQLLDFFQTVADVITAFVTGTPTDFPWEDIFPPWLADKAYEFAKIIEGTSLAISDFANGLGGYDYPWEDVFPDWLADVAYKVSDAFQFVSDHLQAFQGAVMGVAVVLTGAGIYSAIGALTAVIGGISIPIVAIIGASALLGAAWNDNWFGIRDATMPILSALWTGIEDLGTVISEFVSGTPGDFPWEDIFPDWLANSLYTLSDVIDGFGTLMDDFRSGVFDQNYDWGAIFPPSVAELAKTVSDAVYKVGEVMASVQAAFAPLTTSIKENGAGALQEIYNFATGNQTSFDNVKQIWEGLSATASNIFNAIAPIVTAALSSFQTAIAPWAEAALSWITTAVENAPAKLNEWYLSLTSTVSSHLGEWISYLIEWSDPLVSWISTAINGIGPKILEWYTGLTTSVSSYVGQWVTYLMDWSEPLVNWVTTAITNIPGKVLEWYGALTGEIDTWLPVWIDYLLGWSDPLIDWVGTAITNIPGKILEWYTSLSTAVSSHIGEWVSYLIDWSSPLTDWISTAVNGVGGKVGEWYESLSSAISGRLQEWIDTFPEWSDAAVDWITTAATNVGSKMSDFMLKLMASVASGYPSFLAAFLDYESAILGWINTAALNLPTTLAGFGSKLTTWGTGEGLTAIANAVTGFASKFLAWVDDDLIPKVGPALGRVLAEMVIGIGVVAAGVGAAAVAIGGTIYSALTETDWQKVGEDVINLVIQGIKVAGHLIASIGKGFVDEFQKELNLPDWTTVGKNIMTAINTGVNSMLAAIKTSFSTITANITSYFTEPDWGQLGKDIIHLVSDSAVASLSYLLTGIDFVIQSTVASWTVIDWGQLGTDLINFIRDAAVSAASDLYNKMTTIVDTVKKKFVEYDWASAGKAIIDGLKKGIDNNLQALWDKVNGIVDTIKEKIKNALGMGSPAKELIPHGEAIVDGMIVGIKNRSNALYSEMNKVVQKLVDVGGRHPMISNFLPSGIGSEWFTNPSVQGLQVLDDYVSAMGQLESLTNAVMDVYPEDKLVPGFAKVAAQITQQNKQLSLQDDLLNLIRDHNLNPKEILGGKNIADMTGKDLSNAIMAGAYQVNRLAMERLRVEAQEAQRIYDLNQVGEIFGDQVARLAELSKKPMNFFQSMRFDQFQKNFDDLTAQMQSARDDYMSTGSSTALTTLNQLTEQRQKLLEQIRIFESDITFDQAKNSALTGVFQQQSAMLDQAKTLGLSTAQLYFEYFKNADQLSAEALAKQGKLKDMLAEASVTMLQKQIAEKALLSTLDTSWNVSGMAKSFVDMYSDKVMKPLLENLKDVVLLDDQRNAALIKYNQSMDKLHELQNSTSQLTFLNDQISLLQQVKDAGLDIKTVFAGVLSGQSVLGPGANINDLLAISVQLQNQLVQQAQAQLTPQAVALAAHQQQVDEQKAQLDLLNRQLDIIHQGQQAGVNWEGFFNGLTTGINASEEDILTATGRLYSKLIKQALAELGIHSPSTVMMRIGRQTVQGLGIGIGQGFQSLGSYISSVPQGSVSSRNVQMTMGGVNIYNGLDEQILESRIQRVLERAIS